MIWPYILLGISGVVAAGAVIWFLILFFKEKEEPLDDSILLNLNSHLDGSGRAILSEMGTDISSYSGRMVISAIPRDIDFRKMKKYNQKLEPIQIITSPEHLLIFPKGTWSKDKNIKLIMTPTPESMPIGWKKTAFGKMLSEIIEWRNYSKTIEEIIRNGSNLKTQYLTKLGDGEISTELVKLYEDIQKQIIELNKEKQKTSSFSLPTTKSPYE
jgi:hypothetical protein